MSTKAITQREALTEPSLVLDHDQTSFTSHLEGDAVLACAGELGLTTNPALRVSLNRVMRLAPDRVVVDLSRVSFFDAGAVGELVQALTTSRAAGGDLVVRAPSPFVRRVLTIVGLAHLITRDHEETMALSVDAPDVPTGDLADATSALAGQFTVGNRSSVVIDEATGLIAEHFDIGSGEAADLLRTYSTARDQSPQDVAGALMARTIDVARLAPLSLGPSAKSRDGADRGDDDASPSATS